MSRRSRAAALLAAVAGIFALPGRAPAPAAAEDVPPTPTEAVLSTIERHAVRVHFAFRLGGDPDAHVAPENHALVDELARTRRTLRTTGFVVRDRRTVLVADAYVPAAALRSVEIRTPSGATVEVPSHEFLPGTRLLVLRSPKDLDVEPLPFPAVVGRVDDLVVGGISEADGGLVTWTEPVRGARRRTRAAADVPAPGSAAPRVPEGSSPSVELVLRSDGAPVGLRVGGGIDLGEGSWTGASILADLDRSVPVAGLAERAKALHDESFVHEVRFSYRADVGDLADDLGFGTGPFDHEAVPSDDTRWYGLSIAPDLLLVPAALPDGWVRRISKVTVEDEGEPPIEATFAGRIPGTGASVLRLVGATLDAAPAEAPSPPAAGHAFLVHGVAKRAGARRDEVTRDRVAGTTRGPDDRLLLESDLGLRPGSFLLDLDGRILGVVTQPRPATSARAAGAPAPAPVALLVTDAGSPAALARTLDTSVMPVGADESKRLPWLGVEVAPIRGPEVAEALELSGPTKDGARGLLVNEVHGGSPAARAGLRRDDVLLAVRRTKGPGSDAPPIDLRGVDGADLRSSYAGPENAAAPWAPRRNGLVRLLETFGVGTPYELTYCRGSDVLTASLVVEISPRDAASALRERDPEAGITVAELTYEVRQALRLPPDAPGVLVTDVEEGRAAAQARIAVNERIRELDGRPVADPAAFTAALADARLAGKSFVRVAVQRLDRSRFVDLRLGGGRSEPGGGDAPARPRGAPRR